MLRSTRHASVTDAPRVPHSARIAGFGAPPPPRLPATLNSVFASLGIESWKPIVTALLLPPVPLLLLTLIGARLMLPRRGLGWLFIISSVVLMWLTATTGGARLLQQLVIPPQQAISLDRLRELRADVQAKKSVAIVVLGGGVETYAPEYGVSSLQGISLERLRYALFLARETGAPVAASGGVGWGSTEGAAEARVVAKIASEDFGRPIKWIEDQSRDTRENALRTIALLRPAGVTHIVLVTHGWHMPRALRAFREAAGPGITVEAAPMGLARRHDSPTLEWLPSARGFELNRQLLREMGGRLAGA